MFWLIGLMGVGKTTAGGLAARTLDLDFFDTDQLVSASAGTSVADVWRESGESYFRRLERAAVASVPDAPGVAAAGGGAVMDEENREVISAGQSVVWLRCSVEALEARLESTEDRPLLSEHPLTALRRLADERHELYRTMADHVVETELMTAEETAAALVELWTG